MIPGGWRWAGMQGITLAAVLGLVLSDCACTTSQSWDGLQVSLWISVTTGSVFCSFSGNFQLLNSIWRLFFFVLHHLCCITTYVETVTCELCFSILLKNIYIYLNECNVHKYFLNTTVKLLHLSLMPLFTCFGIMNEPMNLCPVEKCINVIWYCS